MIHDLGHADTPRTLPEPLLIDGERYFLVRTGDGYRLFSSVCPHQGGCVEWTAGAFECPQHGWRFDGADGHCTTGSSSQLASFAVDVRDGRLLVDLPAAAAVHGARRERRQPADWPGDLRIRLVGHASLEITQGGFTLLTDPWLTGPAFLGAWITYPNPRVDLSSIRPDAIWISHEHPDHFHPASLAHFDRATPVYVPDFPNGRLPRELRRLGFTQVVPMQFGRAYDLAPDVRITCFEPPGLWNDSIVLMELGGLRLLNINDAGVNHRIAAMVQPVDVLMSAFAPASSYPYAWDHLVVDERRAIAERARVGMLRMLHHAVQRYRPQVLLPFASHFTLWHPSHRRYAAEFRRNTIDDVARAFRRSPVPVIDMLPGGSWEPGRGALDRGPSREGLYDWPVVERWLDETFDQSVFDRHHPPHGHLRDDEIRAYFERLNDVPEIAFCEDLVVTLRTRAGAEVARETHFTVRDGHLEMRHRPHDAENLVIDMPDNVLRHLIQTDASWDDAHVGFWCRFSRTPDVFNAGFWRLLQAPYYLRHLRDDAPMRANGAVAAHANVAGLIERFGAPAERILGRYGLHCGACPHAPAESVASAAERHGVAATDVDRLLRELDRVLLGAPAVTTS